MLPDTLSCLSRLANPAAHAATGAQAASGPGGAAAAELAATNTLRPLDQETFRDIVRFLLGFVSKDKQSEALAEKLLHRLESAESSSSSSSAGSAGGVADEATKALWRDLSYCLSRLPLSEKTVRKLADGVRGYAAALADDDVWESFVDMLARARKLAVGGTSESGGLSKGELREAVDAWENALREARSGSVGEDAALAAAKAVGKRAKRVAAEEGIDADAITATALAAAKIAGAEAEAARKAAAKGVRGKVAAAPSVPSRKASKASKATAEEDDEEDEAPAPRKASAKPAAAPSRRRKGLVVDDEDEEDEAPPPSKVRGAAPPVAPAASRTRK